MGLSVTYWYEKLALGAKILGRNDLVVVLCRVYWVVSAQLVLAYCEPQSHCLYTLLYMSLYSVQFAKTFHILSLPTLVWAIWDGQKSNYHLCLKDERTGTEKLNDLLRVTQTKAGGARSQTQCSRSSFPWRPTVSAVFS